ncbi:MAG: hypothetical protein KDN05_00460 [Verrucomicrobiae bacterium]|nr:hypothetical protein [Verrucomicrobiae bacterium]
MKSRISLVRSHRHALTAILCAGSLLANSCTTQSTAYQVQTQPMSVDLEKKVLQETGLSGALIGAAAGAVIGGALAGGLTAAAGGNSEQIKRNALIGAGLGAAGGGVKGYQEGQKKGQQMVTASMTRDKARQLVKGARAHNQELASFNSALRKKIASVKQFSDPKEKKLAYRTLASQANKKIKEADKLIETRKKALESDKWAKGTGSEKSQYRGLTNEAVNTRNTMASYSAQLAKLDQSVVY